MTRRKGEDLRLHDLRDSLTAEAALAFNQLSGTYNEDVVLWETMLVSAERSRLLARLLKNPGWFISALYNTYGQSEYLSWRDEVSKNPKGPTNG